MIPNRCAVLPQNSVALPSAPFPYVNYCNSRTPFAIHEILGLTGTMPNVNSSNISAASSSLNPSNAASNITSPAQIYCQQNFFDSSGLSTNNSPIFPIEMNATHAPVGSFDYGISCPEGNFTYELIK